MADLWFVVIKVPKYLAFGQNDTKFDASLLGGVRASQAFGAQPRFKIKTPQNIHRFMPFRFAVLLVQFSA
jgi:hypothetical protein